MTALALALVLTAAVIHAVWNLLTKRIGGGAEAVWVFASVGAVVYAPIALLVWWLERPELGSVEYLFLAGSGLLQLLYFVLLVSGYRVGDLSTVYPVARGTGPLLAIVLAVILLGERPGPQTIAGAALIAAGVVVVATDRPAGSGRRFAPGVVYGLGIGAVIAMYTVWDGYAVAQLGIPPVLQGWASEVVRATLLLPIAARRRPAITELWGRHRAALVAVGILSPLAYLLVLIALSISPVSSVAPAREVSIVFGALLGSHLLGEGRLGRRLLAAGVMAFGVVLLAVG